MIIGHADVILVFCLLIKLTCNQMFITIVKIIGSSFRTSPQQWSSKPIVLLPSNWAQAMINFAINMNITFIWSSSRHNIFSLFTSIHLLFSEHYTPIRKKPFLLHHQLIVVLVLLLVSNY